MWGDDDKKIVVAESLGYDYFHRKDKMFANIRDLGFVYNRPHTSEYAWRPNMSKSRSEAAIASKKPTIKLRTMKRAAKIVATVLRTPLGANLAKLMGRGPRHQDIINARADSTTKPLRDFFESLVADEMTPDETFLGQLGQTKF